MTGRRALTLHPFAKINLSLRVGPRQADGFHDVRTLLQAIALHDTLTVTPRRGAFRLVVGTPGVPSGRTNLVWRAATVLWRAMEKRGEPRDVEVRLEKRIPAAAGLGGGSADAAATLVALNRVWRAGLSQTELAAVAAAIGSDVPFFLYGGTALGVGRGAEIYPVQDVKPLGVVLLLPSFGVSTADAYGWLDEDRADGGAMAEPVTPGIDVGWAGRPVALTNDLQRPVARRCPEISLMVEACLREGALGAAMSGSGSAVFGLFALADVRRAIGRLRRQKWVVQGTRTLSGREATRLTGL